MHAATVYQSPIRLTWHQALSYCAHLGMQLPTMEDFENMYLTGNEWIWLNDQIDGIQAMRGLPATGDVLLVPKWRKHYACPIMNPVD